MLSCGLSTIPPTLYHELNERRTIFNVSFYSLYFRRHAVVVVVVVASLLEEKEKETENSSVIDLPSNGDLSYSTDATKHYEIWELKAVFALLLLSRY